MSDSSSNNKRIAKNTILLYIRMIFLMLVSLFTSRVILQVLGVEDYGIYNVVGGFISLFAFLNGAISASTSRYITFALGKGDKNELKKVFSLCVLTHGVIALVILLLAETVGLWFVMNKLVIPPDRYVAAMWVYQCSIISSIVMIMSVPYNSDIIAHERMSAFAYISIIDVCAKLAIVYALLLSPYDKLIIYAILLLGIQIIIRFIYTSYCSRHFEESKFKWIWDKKLFGQLFAFAGWNLWGNLAAALMSQGVNIVLNMFFGPVVNAARGVAVQVQSAVQQFSVNFQMALNPQITKTYANGEYSAMHLLIERSSKFTFILLLCLSLPIIIEADKILELWLGIVPDHTVNFVRLMLVICMIDAVANPLMVGASASGNVKVYQSVIGGILLAIVPVSYFVLKLGAAPEAVFAVHITIAIIAFIARLIIVRPLINLSLRSYAYNVILKCGLIACITTAISLSVKALIPNTTVGSFMTIIFSIIIVLLISYLIGLTKSERLFINNKIQSILHKV